MKTIKLSKETIDKAFEKAEKQSDYAINLYKLAFSEWDDIKHVDGYPRVSETTNKYIFDKAISFDKKNHPNVMNGGLWLDKGFSINEKVNDWEITLEYCLIEYF